MPESIRWKSGQCLGRVPPAGLLGRDRDADSIHLLISTAVRAPGEREQRPPRPVTALAEEPWRLG